MSTCQSCGGLVGRDCYNPSECAWISQRMQEEEQRQYYAEPLDQMTDERDALKAENERLRDVLTGIANEDTACLRGASLAIIKHWKEQAANVLR